MVPSSLRGAEGRWRCRRLLVAFSGSLHQTLSLCPCAATVQRAPSHNRWRVSETTLPAKTQGRTLDCPFDFPAPRVAGWLLMCRCQVCNKAAVALVATGPRRGGGRVAVPLGTGGHPPQGDQPQNWRAPSQETALTTGTPAGRVVRWLISHVVTGVRTSSIVGMLGPELLVHVPTAFPRATVPMNGVLHP